MNIKRKTSVLLTTLISLLCCNQNMHANDISWMTTFLYAFGPHAISFIGQVAMQKLLKEKPPEKTKEEKLEEKLENINERYDYYQDKWRSNECPKDPFLKKSKCKKYNNILVKIQAQQEKCNDKLLAIQICEEYLET